MELVGFIVIFAGGVALHWLGPLGFWCLVLLSARRILRPESKRRTWLAVISGVCLALWVALILIGPYATGEHPYRGALKAFLRSLMFVY